MEESEERRAREQADRLEEQADDMEDRAERLDDEIRSTRSDWESKKQDATAPGAQDEEGAADTDPDALEARRDEGEDDEPEAG